MVRGFNLKLVAICLMMLFIFQIAFPTVSFALTGGPSQPEVQGFTPVGSSNLVDLSSGDFSYNIPLMTVPGPNGGYPINMGYKAGITMEQEASWVGLGWDLNVGSVNRNLRGLPDDFNGGNDIVTKTLSKRKNRTHAVRMNANFKVNKRYRKTGLTLETKKSVFKPSGIGWKKRFGISLIPIWERYVDNPLHTAYYDRLSTDLWFQTDFYNNFKFSAGVNYNFNKFIFEDYSGVFNSAIHSYEGFNLGLNYSSKDGLSGNLSRSDRGSILNGYGVNFGGGQGFTMSKGIGVGEKISLGMRMGVNFAKTAPIGEVPMNNTFTSVIGRFEKGKLEKMRYNGQYGGEYAFSEYDIKSSTVTPEAYGYLHSNNENSGVQDFHLENQMAHYDYSPTLPLPVYDNDVYTVTGQGVSGAFRAYRNDIGMLSNNKKTINTNTISAAAEFGPNTAKTATHIDFDLAIGGGESYSGPWRKNGWDERGNIAHIEDELNFSKKTTDKPLYEPFYLDFIGNTNLSDEYKWSMLDQTSPIAYGVGLNKKNADGQRKKFRTMRAPFGEIAKSSYKRKIKTIAKNTRNVRTSHIGYKTKSDMSFLKGLNNDSYKNIVDFNTFPSSPNQISYGNGESNHINEVSINNGGINYVYGLPVYNKVKEEAYFSVANKKSASSLASNAPATTTIGATDASSTNIHGMDQLYQSTSVSPYATSHLLTGTYSEDYVDLTGNGPTDDDIGYWCKFNYTKAGDFKWRFPFKDANFIEGNYSDVSDKKSDDKASFSYGEKEQYYVNSIETKTHLAIFKTSDRLDNRGVTSRINSALDAKSRRLDKIVLYSKNDPNYGNESLMIPIKTVVFEYDYSQCEQTPNSSAANKGKLTLRKVYFTHQKNTKGALTPYEFNYGGEEMGNALYTSNPDYSYMDNVDRWGNCQIQPLNTNSREFPYTSQTTPVSLGTGLETDKEKIARAWNLTEISLPSGGKMKIGYEQDDYAYVQTSRATQMFEIAGFSKDLSTSTITPEFGDEPKLVVYFDTYKNLPTTISTAELNKYKEGLKNIYFKAFVKLKNVSGEAACEYIEGWAEIDQSFDVKRIGPNRACFKLKAQEFDKLVGTGEIHPIQKAAAQHIHQRGDLMPIANPVRNARILINGPINFYKKKNNWCDRIYPISVNGDKKVSLIRLNNPDKKKLGGGYRVSSIKMSNSGDWMNSDETYGQKFEYETIEGTSSGVADYEPIIGGEENAMKKPVDYADILDLRSLRGGSESYVEKPYAEAYYPSPRVVYSRVITKNITPKDIDASLTNNIANQGGVSVNEYYTSKDYPVYENISSKDNTKKHVRPGFPLPFIADFSDQDLRIFSQGYVIELNDMSGKLKSAATYDGTASSFEKNYKTKVEYLYHDTQDGLNRKRLDNNVTILTDDAVHRKGLIGQKVDYYNFNHENLNWNIHTSGGLNFAIENSTGVFRYIMPDFRLNRSVSQRRMLVTNKVIHKTGILKEVITYDGGKESIATNLAFDAYTGEPIVQKVDNDWDKPIYTYNYSGHWKYSALKGKYNNYKAKFEITKDNASGIPYQYIINGIKISTLLQVGDQLKNSSNVISYVTEIDDDNSTFKTSKKDGTDPLYAHNEVIEIFESGYKNAQSVKVGKLVSLTNPLDFPSTGKFIYTFVSKLNKAIPLLLPPPSVYITEGYVDDCSNPISHSLTGNGNVDMNGPGAEENPNMLTWDGPYLNKAGDPCDIHLKVINSEVFNQLINLTSSGYIGAYEVLRNMNLDLLSFRKGNDGRYLIDFETKGEIFTAEIWTDCEYDCSLKGILHADAVQLSDNWDFNYVDAGNPYIDDSKSTLLASALTGSTPVNPYAYKDAGRWMPYKSWAYQVKRKQSGTTGDNIEINKDGEYETFFRFKWDFSDESNQKKDWEWSNKMTQYSPYGYQLENENRIGIKSSELYGHDNSVALAVAGNASYEEIAFDGFEDYDYYSGSPSPNGFGLINHGHFNFGNVRVVKLASHTGDFSLELDQGTSCQYTWNPTPPYNYFTPKVNKKYVFSAWVLTKDNSAPDITIDVNGTNFTPQVPSDFNQIDGWTKVEIEFNIPSALTSFSVLIEASASNPFDSRIDDIRIHPADASMQTYVYNPYTNWLKAVLDYNNYATFYSRNNEGKLTTVKKETEKGIVTQSANRQNIVK